MTTAYQKEFEAFECLSCHHSWKEPRSVEAEAYQEISSKDQQKEKLRETKWWQ